MIKILGLILAVLAGTGPAGATATPDCEDLAEQAARTEGVPEGVLSAIARVESGRSVQGVFRAWPWTLNQAGVGSYHDSEQSALLTLQQILATGHRNVDIGCMQINLRWHAEAFTDLREMLDPVRNTRYAARFLRELHDRFGDWDEAVMRYHSNDPARGQAYADRVLRQREMAKDTGPQGEASGGPVRTKPPRGLLVASEGALVDLKPKDRSASN